MRRAVIGLGLALGLGCGGAQQPAAQEAGQGSGAARDTRSPIEQRRDAACEKIGPVLTACSVSDAKADLAAGKITQDQYAKDTSADLQHALTQDWVHKCEVPMSSRQVRVLEVCYREENDHCDALQQCLLNLQPKPNGS